MHLDGVVPNVDTYFRAMFASMQARRLGDALFCWEDMRRHGILPDVSMDPLLTESRTTICMLYVLGITCWASALDLLLLLCRCSRTVSLSAQQDEQISQISP